MKISSARRHEARPYLVVDVAKLNGLVVQTGGKVGNDILARLFELGGGKDARLVVIPTANGGDDVPMDWQGLKLFKYFGATNIHHLSNKERAVPHSNAFARATSAS